MSESLFDERFRSAYFPPNPRDVAEGFIEKEELKNILRNNGVTDMTGKANGDSTFTVDGRAYCVGAVAGDGADRYDTAWTQCGTFETLVYLTDTDGKIVIASCDHYWQHAYADGTPSDDCGGREGTYLLHDDEFAERLFPVLRSFLVEKIRSLGSRPWLGR